MPGTKFRQVKDKDPSTETYLAKVSKVESGNNPNAQNPNGSATGLFQFTSGTWEGLNKKYNLGYTLEDRKNPEKAANVMRLFTEENESRLKPVLGRSLTDGEKYMAHFLGAGGATKFYTVYKTNPNAPISTVLSPDALKANKGVVYNKDGSLKTVADIQGWANNKMNVKAEPKIYTPTTEEKTIAYQPTKVFIQGQPTALQTSITEYQEPEEPKETQEVSEAKQEINEKSFLQDLGNVFNQPIVQEQQPVAEEMPSNDEAYNYINIEEYQKGGKYITHNPSDPRFQVYKDSLALYQNQLTPEFMQAKNISDWQRILTTPGVQSKGTKGQEAWERLAVFNGKEPQPIRELSRLVPTGVGNYKTPIRVDEYKKPTQEVVYQPLPLVTPPKPRVKVQSISGKLRPSEINIEEEPLTATPLPSYPTANLPEYYTIEDTVHGAMGDSSTSYRYYPGESSEPQKIAPEPYNSRKVTSHYKKRFK